MGRKKNKKKECKRKTKQKGESRLLAEDRSIVQYDYYLTF
jgi:hypothetical protein